jgi:phage regulator Rha-like protein
MATGLKSVSFEGAHCAVVLEQLSESLIVMRLTGTDTGELRDAPIKTLNEWLVGVNAVEFFIDARNVRGASVDVSSEWSAWFTANRTRFKTITMLTGSKFIQITAEFVRRFAGLNGIMWVCTEPKVFDLALEQAQRRRHYPDEAAGRVLPGRIY